MEISYQFENMPDPDEVINLYNQSGLNRPTSDRERIISMYRNSNLIATARDGGKLVGIARALSDFSYCCYLSDLAVNKAYQKQGIGLKLISICKEKIGPQVMLLLLSAPAAMDYYPKVGFEKVENGFIIKRSK